MLKSGTEQANIMKYRRDIRAGRILAHRPKPKKYMDVYPLTSEQVIERLKARRKEKEDDAAKHDIRSG